MFIDNLVVIVEIRSGSRGGEDKACKTYTQRFTNRGLVEKFENYSFGLTNKNIRFTPSDSFWI
jgi:hypothetical protein